MNHNLLLDKIAKLPLPSVVFSWFVDFLADRQQRVVFDEQTTNFLPINRGIPQGTVGGALLFAFFVEDLKPKNSHARLSKYADDGTLTLPVYDDHGKSSHEEMNNIQTWCQQNSTEVNLSKTKEMVCSFSKSILSNLPNALLKIEQIMSAKLLGYIFQYDVKPISPLRDDLERNSSENVPAQKVRCADKWLAIALSFLD